MGDPDYWSFHSKPLLTMEKAAAPDLQHGKRASARLDSSYFPRTSDFFRVGKVFATLLTEPIESPGDSSNVFIVAFGERVYSHIARFVVVQAGKGFVYCCPVTTYGDQGTKKKGCNPSEHAILYLRGDIPTLLSDELPLTKQPIAVRPSGAEIGSFSQASRVRFGRSQAFQSNIKAKDIGDVTEEDIPRLVSYWREEMGMGGCWTDSPKREKRTDTMMGAEEEVTNYKLSTRAGSSSSTAEPHLIASQQDSNDHGPRRYDLLLDGIQYTLFSEIGGSLHSGYELIDNPKKYFKRGRVFMILSSELTTRRDIERAIYVKVRRYVVIRQHMTTCLCLPIHTYRGQATTKPGVSAEDHAAIVPIGGNVELHPGEMQPKGPVYIKVEDPGLTIHPMSRIDFSSVSTIPFSTRVRKVGRLIAMSVRDLEEYFANSLKLGNS